MKMVILDGQYVDMTQADAKRAAKAMGTTWQLVDVPTDKSGLIGYLNGLLKTLDPDGDLALAEPPEAPPPVAPAVTRAEYNCMIEEAIGEASYPRALALAEHIHSRLMEHAKGAGAAS